jgi:hypothetical protein
MVLCPCIKERTWTHNDWQAVTVNHSLRNAGRIFLYMSVSYVSTVLICFQNYHLKWQLRFVLSHRQSTCSITNLIRCAPFFSQIA